MEQLGLLQGVAMNYQVEAELLHSDQSSKTFRLVQPVTILDGDTLTVTGVSD